MKSLPKLLLSYLKKVFSDLHGVIIGIIVGFLLSGATIYLFFENLWIWIKTTIQLPTPLWVTTALVLLLFVYLIIVTNRSFKKSESNNSANWENTTKLQYDLVMVEGGYIYTPNKKHPSPTPIHYLCPKCFENKKKSLLQKWRASGYTSFDDYYCPECKFEIKFNPINVPKRI